jgi:hypothetical protein
MAQSKLTRARAAADLQVHRFWAIANLGFSTLPDPRREQELFNV